MNNIYTQFLVDNDACDTSTPVRVKERPRVIDSHTYIVEVPLSLKKAWLVAMDVNLTLVDITHGGVFYMTNLKSEKVGTSTSDVPIYYISAGNHRANLKNPLLVEDYFRFSSKVAELNFTNSTNIAIPLKSYTFYFLRDDIDYCTGYELCSGLVTMYTESYQSVRTRCKNVDVIALEVKYGMCASKSLVLTHKNCFEPFCT